MKRSHVAKAILLAATLAVATIPARPAQAVTVGQVVSALKTAYSLYEKYGKDELSLEEATDQIISAINSAKVEIIARIDAIAAADARACAKSTIIQFEDIELLSEDAQFALASSAIDCMTLIESYLEVVDDKPSVDKLGFALNALGPVTMMLRAHVGLPESAAVSDMLINGNYAIIAKLHPTCQTMTLWGDSDGGFVEKNVRCRAYNGDIGMAFSWVGDPNFATKKTQAEDKATRNTSRKIAQELVGEIPIPKPSWSWVIGKAWF